MHVSVSQAKTFDDCNMKWYLDKVEGIRPPATPALEFGNMFHEMMENIANGKPFEYLLEKSKLLKKIFDRNEEYILNVANKQGVAEKEIREPLIGGVDFLGYVDFTVYEPNKIIIDDYKTVGDWKWALTINTLGGDPQLNIYAYYEDEKMTKDGDSRPIYIRHIQFNKKTYTMKEVLVPYNAVTGRSMFQWMQGIAFKIIDTRKMKLGQVPKNKKSCSKYGGCPFQDFCNSTLSIEELRDMYNPNVKERNVEELEVMKPEERLEEVEKEQNFNKILNGDKKMNSALVARMKLLKNKNKEKADDFKAEPEPKPEETVTSEERPEVGDTPSRETVVVDKPIAEPKKPVKKITRKSKKVSGKPLVFMGCNILEEKLPFLSELVHDMYIQPIIDEAKVPFAACIEFGKWKSPLYLQAEKIIDFLKEQEAFVVDHKRPVDSFICTLIGESGRQDEFRFIRSCF